MNLEQMREAVYEPLFMHAQPWHKAMMAAYEVHQGKYHSGVSSNSLWIEFRDIWCATVELYMPCVDALEEISARRGTEGSNRSDWGGGMDDAYGQCADIADAALEEMPL